MSRNHYSKYQRNAYERERIDTEWTISPHKEIQIQAGSTNYPLNHINYLGHVI
jgi:hypothetical protein